MSTLTVRSTAEIPDADYRKMVLTLMDKQASREVATAEVFGQCVLFAPTVEDTAFVLAISQTGIRFLACSIEELIFPC